MQIVATNTWYNTVGINPGHYSRCESEINKVHDDRSNQLSIGREKRGSTIINIMVFTEV